MNFATFLRTAFLQNTTGRLLLYHSVLTITRIWIYVTQCIKTCSYIQKTFTHLMLLLCFRFEIFFKINLFLPLGFKVIRMWKFFTNSIFFNSLTTVIAEFPTSNLSNLIFVIPYLCKKDRRTCLCSFYSQFIWQDLAIAS